MYPPTPIIIVPKHFIQQHGIFVKKKEENREKKKEKMRT